MIISFVVNSITFIECKDSFEKRKASYYQLDNEKRL